MKFYNYLREQEDYREYFDEIEKNCQIFLNDLKKIGDPDSLLYSGRKSSEPFIYKKTRKDRKPRDIPREFHNWLNKWFEWKFGVKARSQTVFTTPDKDDADSFGDPFIIFPIGKYKLIWSEEVGDLYLTVVDDKSLFEQIMKMDFKDIKPNKEYSQKLNELIEALNSYKENDLEEALIRGGEEDGGGERMLVCDEYYGINIHQGPDQDILWQWFNKKLGIKVHPHALAL